MTTVPPNYLTVQEVAAILRVSDQTIRAMCRRLEFAGARKVGDQWRIPYHVVEYPRPNVTNAESY